MTGVSIPPIVATASERPAAARDLPRVETRPDSGFYLLHDAHGLRLCHAGAAVGDAGVRVDLCDGRVERRAAGGRQSPLARALGLRRHPQSSILDATCGLGRDSATLAALGCCVMSIERHPVLHALVADARDRAIAAASPPAWLAHWSAHVQAEASDWLRHAAPESFDVIYIDPMFDASRRKARPQKALAWMHTLIGSDTDVDSLLIEARQRATRQVVIKQHARAAPIARPSRQVEGKAIRFDIYLT